MGRPPPHCIARVAFDDALDPELGPALLIRERRRLARVSTDRQDARSSAGVMLRTLATVSSPLPQVAEIAFEESASSRKDRESFDIQHTQREQRRATNPCLLRNLCYGRVLFHP